MYVCLYAYMFMRYTCTFKHVNKMVFAKQGKKKKNSPVAAQYISMYATRNPMWTGKR